MSKSDVLEKIIELEVAINEMVISNERDSEKVLQYLTKIVDDPNFAVEIPKNLEVASEGRDELKYGPSLMLEHFMPVGYPYPEHCPGLAKSAEKQLPELKVINDKIKKANPSFLKDLGLIEKVDKRMKREPLRCPYCVQEKLVKKSNNAK